MGGNLGASGPVLLRETDRRRTKKTDAIELSDKKRARLLYR